MIRRTSFAAGLLVGLIGCSGTRTTAEMNEVRGQVTLKGQPVEKMIMNLSPVVPGQGREDECVVQRGEYRVKVIAARYRVSFTQCPGGPPVPAPYRVPAESQLVLDGTKPETANFELR